MKHFRLRRDLRKKGQKHELQKTLHDHNIARIRIRKRSKVAYQRIKTEP